MDFKKLGYGMFEIDGVEYCCADEFLCTNIDQSCLMDSNDTCCACGECLRKMGVN